MAVRSQEKPEEEGDKDKSEEEYIVGGVGGIGGPLLF